MTKNISYGTTNISYSVEFRDRKTMAIEVYPDTSVKVVAPLDATPEKIQAKVEKRAGWIAKQQRAFSGKKKSIYQHEWVSGENIYYLGRQYRLKVEKGEKNVKLAGKYLWVFVPDRRMKKEIEQLVNGWHLKHAKKKFEDRLKMLQPMLEREGLQMNTLIVRKLEKRWGSCTPKGNIVINSELIKAPIHCIDYVLIHELCHLKHHHHGPEFWKLLTKYCPDWVKLKDKLEVFLG
jgi:predicted metal-dependent hydrolase